MSEMGYSPSDVGQGACMAACTIWNCSRGHWYFIISEFQFPQLFCVDLQRLLCPSSYAGSVRDGYHAVLYVHCILESSDFDNFRFYIL